MIEILYFYLIIIKDLEMVANSFLEWGTYYCYRKVDDHYWKNFTEDSKENLLFDFDLKLLEFKE